MLQRLVGVVEVWNERAAEDGFGSGAVKSAEICEDWLNLYIEEIITDGKKMGVLIKLLQ